MNTFNGYNGYGGYGNGRYFSSPTFAMPNFQQQPQQPQQPNGIFFNNIRYVNPNEMASYVVLAGNTDLLICKENGIMQIKSADMAGNSFTRSFKYEELKDGVQQQNKQPEIDLEQFVKKDDLKDFIKIDALTQFSKQLDEKFEKLEKKIKISEILEDKK